MPENISVRSSQMVVIYTIIGVLFGFIFPNVATIIELSQNQLDPTIANVVGLHQSNRLLLMLDFAPVIMGIFGFALGLKSEQLIESEQRRFGSTLFKINNLQKMILDATDYSIISTDLNGTIVEFNRGAEKLLDYRASDMVGTQQLLLFHDPNEVEARAKELSERYNRTVNPGLEVFLAKLGKGETSMGEWTYVGKNGKKIEVLLSFNSLKNEDGEVIGYLEIARDITEQKEAERKKEVYLKQVEKKNEELDKFAYVVSHDLKAPLRAINNLSEWIEEDLGETAAEEIKTNMATLRGRVHRLEDLINGILLYSKIGRKQLPSEELDTRAMVEEIVSLLPKADNFSIDISEKLPKIQTPKVLLYQVFSNLISNALKHNNSGGGLINIGVQENGRYFIFNVKDNGPGIDPKFHERIFGIFQTLESRDTVENTGIGLSIVKKIIEEQGGNIKVESEAGSGANFIFTWPKAS